MISQFPGVGGVKAAVLGVGVGVLLSAKTCIEKEKLSAIKIMAKPTSLQRIIFFGATDLAGMSVCSGTRRPRNVRLWGEFILLEEVIHESYNNNSKNN